jgi:hypothetical protein
MLRDSMCDDAGGRIFQGGYSALSSVIDSQLNCVRVDVYCVSAHAAFWPKMAEQERDAT